MTRPVEETAPEDRLPADRKMPASGGRRAHGGKGDLPSRGPRRASRGASYAAHAGLAVIALAGLWLRLWNNDYGLPYVYNVDEGSHFTNRAVEMFGGDLNPGYFQNPSGFTYLVHALLRVKFGLVGAADRVPEQFREDPSAIYDTARSLAAVLCLVGVVAVYWVGRRLWGAWEGLGAAALMSFAFLLVAYGRIAVTDAGALAPVALALYGAVRIGEGGGRGAFLLAGAAGGLAVGFKYTAGLALLPVLIAVVMRGRSDRRVIGSAALAFAASVIALLVTTPFLLLDLDTAVRQLGAQAETAGEFPKLGQRDDVGALYYLDSLVWGLGWAGSAAALIGLAVVARRDAGRALLLAALPLALFVYLSVQSRYFGRWLLPAYPALALLAGVALGALVRRLPARVPLRPAFGMVALVALVAQPLAADVRTARVLGREDTRAQARRFLVEQEKNSLRIVIEPAVPARYYRLVRPGEEFPPSRKQFVRGFARDVRETRLDYAATLRPERIDAYRNNGYCMVMTFSVIRGRAEEDRTPAAVNYYRRLERESDLVFQADPYKPGRGPVPFHFDLSYNYFPTAFERPGPVVRIYRLRDCLQGYGPTERGRGRPIGARGRRS